VQANIAVETNSLKFIFISVSFMPLLAVYTNIRQQRYWEFRHASITPKGNFLIFFNNEAEAVSKVFLRQFFCKTFGIIRIILYIYT
jgi:hypothetical protein